MFRDTGPKGPLFLRRAAAIVAVGAFASGCANSAPAPTHTTTVTVGPTSSPPRAPLNLDLGIIEIGKSQDALRLCSMQIGDKAVGTMADRSGTVYTVSFESTGVNLVTTTNPSTPFNVRSSRVTGCDEESGESELVMDVEDLATGNQYLDGKGFTKQSDGRYYNSNGERAFFNDGKWYKTLGEDNYRVGIPVEGSTAEEVENNIFKRAETSAATQVGMLWHVVVSNESVKENLKDSPEALASLEQIQKLWGEYSNKDEDNSLGGKAYNKVYDELRKNDGKMAEVYAAIMKFRDVAGLTVVKDIKNGIFNTTYRTKTSDGKPGEDIKRTLVEHEDDSVEHRLAYGKEVMDVIISFELYGETISFRGECGGVEQPQIPDNPPKDFTPPSEPKPPTTPSKPNPPETEKPKKEISKVEDRKKTEGSKKETVAKKPTGGGDGASSKSSSSGANQGGGAQVSKEKSSGDPDTDKGNEDNGAGAKGDEPPKINWGS